MDEERINKHCKWIAVLVNATLVILILLSPYYSEKNSLEAEIIFLRDENAKLKIELSGIKEENVDLQAELIKEIFNQ